MVGFRVEALRKILIDECKVFGGRLDEVYDRYIGDGMSCRLEIPAPCQSKPQEYLPSTYKCIVTPHVRKSLTRSTLLITSLPRLSNTRTFHIGSPSEFRIGVALGMRPSAAVGPC